jgi:hypothetical protein
MSKKRLRVYMKHIKVNKWFCLTHHHYVQILASFSWIYLHTEPVAWLITNIQKKLYDGSGTSTKRSVELQPSQWNSTKNKNILTYLFVLKRSYEHISRKKTWSPKNPFQTYFLYSHSVSKSKFGKHPLFRIWAGRTHALLETKRCFKNH